MALLLIHLLAVTLDNYLIYCFLCEMGQRRDVKEQICRVQVAHAYNPSYSGGRDQDPANDCESI
jgi:hypothetical protein